MFDSRALALRRMPTLKRSRNLEWHLLESILKIIFARKKFKKSCRKYIAEKLEEAYDIWSISDTAIATFS